MNRPVAALLLVVLGFALIAGLRLAVPHVFVRASDTEAEQTNVAGSRLAHAPPNIEVSQPALPEAVDPHQHAGGAEYTSAASESTGWIDSAIEPGALFGDPGIRPDTSTSSAANSGFANNARGSGSAAFGADYFSGGSGGMNGIDFRSNGNPPGSTSSLAGGVGSVLGADDLQALLPVPGNATPSDLPGGTEIPGVQGEGAAASASVPVSEPPMHLLIFLILPLLWFIGSRVPPAARTA